MKNKGYRLMLLLLITTGWFFLMRSMTSPLDPGTILQFEFIGTAEKAKQFLSNLKEAGHLKFLTLSIYLDIIFALLYGAVFFYASAWACGKLTRTHILNRFRLLSSLTILAVICDLLENASMLQLIQSAPTDFYAKAAFYFAGLKFLLLAIVMLHFLISWIISGISSSDKKN